MEAEFSFSRSGARTYLFELELVLLGGLLQSPELFIDVEDALVLHSAGLWQQRMCDRVTTLWLFLESSIKI